MRVAELVARLFNGDVKSAKFGAAFPDIDIYPPFIHRRGLHNPLIPFIISLFGRDRHIRGFVVGFVTHLFLDGKLFKNKRSSRVRGGCRK